MNLQTCLDQAMIICHFTATARLICTIKPNLSWECLIDGSDKNSKATGIILFRLMQNPLSDHRGYMRGNFFTCNSAEGLEHSVKMIKKKEEKKKKAEPMCVKS